eukprot:816548-Prymnesium_polylepis.1
MRANNDARKQRCAQKKDGKVKMTDYDGKKKSSPKKAARYQQFDDEVELQPGEDEGGGGDCGGEKGDGEEEALQSVAVEGLQKFAKLSSARGTARQDEPSNYPPRAPVSYRADVDGLRAVAVVAVIIYHLDKTWLPGGFIGVDIFFVISGFVVTGSLLAHQAPNAAGFLAGFYSRRVKRLAPALTVTVLISVLAMSALIPPAITDQRDYLFSAQLALLGMANNYYATFKTGYWDKGLHTLEYNPFTHMWSLGVEEQFYFIFPLIVLLGYGRLVSRSSPSIPAWKWPPARLLAICCALSLLVST